MGENNRGGLTGGVTVRPATDQDRDPLVAALRRAWGTTTVIVHGVAHDLTALPALVAEHDGQLAGMLTYHVADSGFEVVSIEALRRGVGIGSMLLQAAVSEARRRDLPRLWLVTTNDNLDAIRFYQRRGLRLCAVRPGAVDLAREQKPEIPPVGGYGIEIRDELVFELRLTSDAASAHPAVAGRAAALRLLRWHHGHADTWPLLRDPVARADVVRGLAYPFLGQVDVVLAPEARGLTLGALVAAELTVPFAPVRKRGGPLAGPRLSTVTGPDYLGRRHTIGVQQAALHAGARVLVVDDWAESGALLTGISALVHAGSATVAGIALVVDEMPDKTRTELTRTATRIEALVRGDDLPPI